MKWLAIVVLSGCVASNSVVCGDGRVCPDGTACDQTHALCVAPDQLTVCNGLAEGAACTAGPIVGTCTGGTCLPAVCGDHIVEAGEACDDGNNADGDGCSADCTSDETCGNHVIDAIKGELCDDGNHIDHDGCSSSCLIETPRWVEHTIAPTARNFAAAAYDSRRGRTVMFGGGAATTEFVLDDTWEWNGGEWVRFSSGVTPPGRAVHAMAFDAARGVTVMFGGTVGLFQVGDTWLWDGATWTSADAAGPSARDGMTMAYDSRRERVILFGGQSFDGMNTTYYNDTWEWDGASWTQIHTAHAPSARDLEAMTYDPKHGVIVLAGGEYLGGLPFQDTWQYDGTDWTNVTPTTGTVPQLERAAMAFDTTGERVLMFGGESPAGVQATTWAWNGSAWSTVSGAAPSARENLVLAQAGSRLVTFGGDGAGGVVAPQTWVFANGWSQMIDPGTLDSFVMANDPIRTSAIVFEGVSSRNPSVVRSPSTFVLSQLGFALRAGAPPTARSNPCFAYDYAHHNFVMFGGNTGANNGIANNETWIWDGTGWSQRFPSQSPSVRGNAACAFDGRAVTLFGGIATDGSAATDDAWTWDGTNWAPAATPPPALTARINGAAAYDPIRKQLVMFGGFNAIANKAFDETWFYDGTAWTLSGTAFRPSPRFGATLTWNAARQVLVLAGGEGGPVSFFDTYEWDGARWHTVSAVNPPSPRFQHGAITSLDGSGLIVYGGLPTLQGASQLPMSDRWELVWEAAHASESCGLVDTDGDGLVGCADPDCWWVCAPLCPPGTTCDPTAPRCGDGTCDASREDCRTCPVDCTCTPVCGDGICDPGETACPGDCP